MYFYNSYMIIVLKFVKNYMEGIFNEICYLFLFYFEYLVFLIYVLYYYFFYCDVVVVIYFSFIKDKFLWKM